MSLSILFWTIYIISLLFGLWANWPVSSANVRPFGSILIVYVLIGILGWAQFGAAVHK